MQKCSVPFALDTLRMIGSSASANRERNLLQIGIDLHHCPELLRTCSFAFHDSRLWSSRADWSSSTARRACGTARPGTDLSWRCSASPCPSTRRPLWRSGRKCSFSRANTSWISHPWPWTAGGFSSSSSSGSFIPRSRSRLAALFWAEWKLHRCSSFLNCCLSLQGLVRPRLHWVGAVFQRLRLPVHPRCWYDVLRWEPHSQYVATDNFWGHLAVLFCCRFFPLLFVNESEN